MSTIEVVMAVILPPVAVAIRYGLSGKFWLNLLLTIIGWIPGVIHAVYVLTRDKGNSSPPSGHTIV